MTTKVAGAVPWEASAVVNDQPGVSVYDAGFPLPTAPRFKATDADVYQGVEPDSYVKWSDLDYEIGGERGAVNRNAYVDNSMYMSDAHDFRGDHAVIPQHYPYGSYGDVGSSDDYATQYALGIASNAYPDISTTESWDEVSQGF